MLLLSLSLRGQNLIENNFPTKNGQIFYSGVVNGSGDLYLNCKKWLVTAFKSSKSVIQTDAKELIIVKSFIRKSHVPGIVYNAKNWFTLMIEMKEGRYKYTLNDIRYEFDLRGYNISAHKDVVLDEWMKYPTSTRMSEKKKLKTVNRLNEHCKELDSEFLWIIESLKEGMNEVEASNW